MVSNKENNPWATGKTDAKVEEPFKMIVSVILGVALVIYFISLLSVVVQLLIYAIIFLVIGFAINVYLTKRRKQ